MNHTPKNQTPNRLLRAAASVLLSVGLLTGCASAPTDLQPGIAAKLQERLQSLAQFAADEDFSATRVALDLIAEDVSTAAAQGELSAARLQEIAKAIDLIHTDLDTLLSTPSPSAVPTAVPTPSPIPVPAPEPDVVPAPVPAPEIVPIPAPAPEGVQPAPGKDNSKDKKDTGKDKVEGSGKKEDKHK